MSDIRIDDHGHVRVVVFDRPAKKNAFTLAMYADVTRALQAAAVDERVRVVVLTGAGGVYTAGNDLAEFQTAADPRSFEPVLDFLAALVDFEKPLVAAVNGPAIGIGTTMLLHCDLVYATPDAVLHTPFVDLGLCPEGASSVLLPAVAGLQRATSLLMLGERLGAEQAREIGLVNAVLTEDGFLDDVLGRAARLAARPPAAVRATKRLLRHDVRERSHAAIARESELFFERLQSPEAAEAFQAFFERRPPDFSRFT